MEDFPSQAFIPRKRSDIAPWDRPHCDDPEYDNDPALQAAVAEYAKHRYADGESSSQNKEELHRQQELSTARAKQYRWDNQDEWQLPREVYVGKPMKPQQLLEKLQSVGLNCWYVDHPWKDRVTLVVQRNSWSKPEVGCWVQWSYNNEFTEMNFDSHNVPTTEKRRGWRTVLLQLITKGLLTEDQARKAFGEATGPASNRYNRTLYQLRNRPRRGV